MLAEALAEAPGDPTQDLKRCSRKHHGSTCEEIIAEGSVEARCVEVPTKRKLVFAEAPRKLAGRRVVFQRNKSQLNCSCPGSGFSVRETAGRRGGTNQS